MLTYPKIDPVLIHIGPVSVHWYGVMYLLGFVAGLWLAKTRARKSGSGWTVDQVDDLLVYIVLGIILGGRMGYVFIYHIDLFFQNPLYLFKIWQGGMSFHGGFIGVTVALWLFARKHNKKWIDVGDFTAPLIPPGLAFGRLGNFINGELWGRTTDVPWGMIFPNAGDLPRHPSQLYQFAGEGVLLFILMWWFSSKPRPRYAVTAMFMIGYGAFRTMAEFFRQPDDQLGFLAFDFLTMGMLLSVPMVIIGTILMIYAYRKGELHQKPNKL
ncbi:prolipoprotein diacylglyceryl transferase [Gynuella sunshinyii]|nr:prolipoprotein diacylglyceryl transferase [Gynuella sunshinyii]